MNRRHDKTELDRAMRDLLNAELEASAPHHHGAPEAQLARSPHAIDATRVHEALRGWTPKLN